MILYKGKYKNEIEANKIISQFPNLKSVEIGLKSDFNIIPPNAVWYEYIIIKR